MMVKDKDLKKGKNAGRFQRLRMLHFVWRRLRGSLRIYTSAVDVVEKQTRSLQEEKTKKNLKPSKGYYLVILITEKCTKFRKQQYYDHGKGNKVILQDIVTYFRKSDWKSGSSFVAITFVTETPTWSFYALRIFKLQTLKKKNLLYFFEIS